MKQIINGTFKNCSIFGYTNYEAIEFVALMNTRRVQPVKNNLGTSPMIIAISGKGVPRLTIGTKVRLVGDSRGYIPAGEVDQETIIIGFSLPFEHGGSDHIIMISEGNIKPTNIELIYPGVVG